MSALIAYGLIIPDAPYFQSIGAPTDGRFGDVIDRDRLVAGRSPDPAAPDEVTIGEGLAAQPRAGRRGPPRRRVVLPGADPGHPERRARRRAAGGTADPPAGGRHRSPAPRPRRADGLGGLVVLSRAFGPHYGDRVGVFGDRIRLRTDHGVADVPEVVAASKRILGDSLFIAQGLAVDAQGASNAIDVLALALWIGAGVAALAGVVTIAIVLDPRGVARQRRPGDAPRAGVRSPAARRRLGRARAGRRRGRRSARRGPGRRRVTAVPLRRRPAAPIPTVGLHADWTVLLLGRRRRGPRGPGDRLRRRPPSDEVGPRSGRPRRGRRARRSWPTGCAAAGLAPPLASGVRMALEPGRGRTAVPVRTAFVGAAVGVLGVTAVLVFSANVDHLAATPRTLRSDRGTSRRSTSPSNTPCGGGRLRPRPAGRHRRAGRDLHPERAGRRPAGGRHGLHPAAGAGHRARGDGRTPADRPQRGRAGRQDAAARWASTSATTSRSPGAARP